MMICVLPHISMFHFIVLFIRSKFVLFYSFHSVDMIEVLCGRVLLNTNQKVCTSMFEVWTVPMCL